MPISASHVALGAARGHVGTAKTVQPMPQPVIRKEPEWVGATVALVLFIGLFGLIVTVIVDGLNGKK